MKVTELSNFRRKCTGCQACVQTCPVRAIRMNYSEDGFLYPTIDENTCINCGACINVCTMEQKKEEAINCDIFSAQAKNETILRKSSSGGVFKLLADVILKDKGVVFGAFFNSTNKEVRHCSTDEVPLESLMQSKYVQSNISGTYQQVAEMLKQRRKVLFSGTPCQIHGLKNYLKQKQVLDDYLLTVDFKCHGVPSVRFFQAWLKDLENKKNSKLIDITFREKDLGWRKQISKAYFENGEVWTQPSRSHYYYYYFLQNYSLRDSCYSCEEYRYHASDITLADDWISRYEKNDAGTSLIFVHTERGEIAFNAISQYLNIRDVKLELPDLSVYSHEGYDYKRKQWWLKAWKSRGLGYVSGIMFTSLYYGNGCAAFVERCKNYLKKSFRAKR